MKLLHRIAESQNPYDWKRQTHLVQPARSMPTNYVLTATSTRFSDTTTTTDSDIAAPGSLPQSSRAVAGTAVINNVCTPVISPQRRAPHPPRCSAPLQGRPLPVSPRCAARLEDPRASRPPAHSHAGSSPLRGSLGAGAAAGRAGRKCGAEPRKEAEEWGWAAAGGPR